MRSNAEGVPPRCTWPSTVTRVSKPSLCTTSCPSGESEGVFAFVPGPTVPPRHGPPALGLAPHVLLQGFWSVSSQAPTELAQGARSWHVCGCAVPRRARPCRWWGAPDRCGAHLGLRGRASQGAPVCAPHIWLSLGVRKPSRSLLPVGRGSQQEYLGTEIKGSSLRLHAPMSPGLPPNSRPSRSWRRWAFRCGRWRPRR